jgi:hypothetical protein
MIKIRVGYEPLYDFPQSTPMIMILSTHFSRASDIVVPDHLTITEPAFLWMRICSSGGASRVATIRRVSSTPAAISDRHGDKVSARFQPTNPPPRHQACYAARFWSCWRRKARISAAAAGMLVPGP